MKRWPSPAKINLFLHITGQREDGYHELQTVFQFLDYGDYIEYAVTDNGAINLLNSVAGIDDKDNLVYRAAKLLQKESGTEFGVNITLDKRLPMGGGLGGGSSNAATTLVALNQLWSLNYSDEFLMKLGLSLGADIPVFIYGHASWAEGIGEKLTDIFPPEPWYVVIVPDCMVSTAEIFSSAELTRNCEPITISRFLLGEGSNVCEAYVRQHYPPVAEAFDWLSHYAKPRMTGTGACVFAGFNSKEQAQQVVTKMPKAWQAFLAKGCNQSPLIV